MSGFPQVLPPPPDDEAGGVVGLAESFLTVDENKNSSVLQDLITQGNSKGKMQTMVIKMGCWRTYCDTFRYSELVYCNPLCYMSHVTAQLISAFIFATQINNNSS